MIKVITYGTYDLLHYGHIRLLERAKELGDYLIVGVTADSFDKSRGKINVQQSLMERVEAVRETGLADEIIVEEYEGQKIDDIKRYSVDIFTVGSDWYGKFDYLNEYCKVVYLDRTQGISSTQIRDKKAKINIGLVGASAFMNKFARECSMVNGVQMFGICCENVDILSDSLKELPIVTDDYNELLKHVDAVYIRSIPEKHYEQISVALEAGKHVLCESPMVLSETQAKELYEIAREKKLILMVAIKTAYATAFSRLINLVKSGVIGDVLSIDSTCTSLIEQGNKKVECVDYSWKGIYEWGPTALLPVFELFGTDYERCNIYASYRDLEHTDDRFVKMDFTYENATATIKVGNGIKSEGELVISGTTGYVYVPAPWWKTDYFEVRYENPQENRRYFYQLEGEGIRYEIVAFVQAIERNKKNTTIEEQTSIGIVKTMEKFLAKDGVKIL